ncbi:DUF2012 domain-containing protein [Mycena indigotica]|uniref:DUF2012 domain-containing protein n=1 Tax=Mycena indigotica TaxID=2126181 RepID=A0A8H6SWI6_9AGAR|nr:DUF2012 domain-containing protein [Mycena indigotica]KAF7306664.1 DUF2012 domain-containing protein [Mycena indigotica]
MTVFVFLLSLLSFALSILAVDVKGSIKWNELCPDVRTLGSAQAILDHGYYKGSIIFDGSFTMYLQFLVLFHSSSSISRPNVSHGVYILSIVSHDHVFDQLRIDVHETGYFVRPYSVGTALNPPSTIIMPEIALLARATHSYYMPPQSFNLMGMLGSPMVLLFIFGGGMVLAMPYLMNNMDPEMMKEFRESQAKASQLQSAMASGDLRAGFSALMAEEPPAAAPAPPGVPKTRSGPKNRRR